MTNCMDSKYLAVIGRFDVLFRKVKFNNFRESPWGTRNLPKDLIGKILDKDNNKLPSWNRLRNTKGK